MDLTSKAYIISAQNTKMTTNSRSYLFKRSRTKFLEPSLMMFSVCTCEDILAAMIASFSQSNLKLSLFMTQGKIKDTSWERWTTFRSVVRGKFNRSNLEYSDGPAIWVNEKLSRGQTNKSNTFNNEILTLGQKNHDDVFDIHNLEVFILWSHSILLL